MSRAPFTHTLGQVHLEDLEPHRFEDLVRQLLYDFRSWRSLEATGRSGGDKGFDARGREVIVLDPLQQSDEPAVDTEETEQDEDLLADERLWMVQCKREKSIGPSKARKLIAELAPGCVPIPPYGLVFVAPTDLSKDTRDAIREEARKLGLQEIHIWAKGEIEDQLFQPKNDHLLFAYTGISLQIRRRSVRTEVRGRLAAKRKLVRALAKMSEPVLILEASDARFPVPEGPEGGLWSRRRHWNVYSPGACRMDGLRILWKRCWAICDPETGQWDIEESTDSATPGEHADPWWEESNDRFNHDPGLWTFWSSQGYKKAMYVEERVLPYERVIDVDKFEGDPIFGGPIIYVDDFHPEHGPFLPEVRRRLESAEQYGGWGWMAPKPELRTKLFLGSYPQPDSSGGG
jgi:hypothetical protein